MTVPDFITLMPGVQRSIVPRDDFERWIVEDTALTFWEWQEKNREQMAANIAADEERRRKRARRLNG